MTTDTFDANAELDRQIEKLLKLRYPDLSGRSEESFLALVEPLRVAADPPLPRRVQ